jgi:APA family basic amino acid/polyamine antiporter
MPNRLFRTKRVDVLLKESEEPGRQLKRSLGALDITALGIGAIIGAGIFAMTGIAAAGGPNNVGAGPALIVSFVITGIACGFAALCYAEVASMIPISGSAYTYSYATMGELIGWIIGWDLILEYAVGNIAVAISWAGYFKELLGGFGIDIPIWLTVDLRTALNSPDIMAQAPHIFGIPVTFNLLAVLIVGFVTYILVIGIRESATFNSIMVGIKLVILIFFVVVGAFYVKPEHWSPFAPNGLAGIQAGAALVFFAYIGFDAVSTAAEETKNPSRNLPIGIIASLIICTIIYIAVAAVLTGLVPYQQLASAKPLAVALNANNLNWVAWIVSFGAVVATTAVLLVFQLGQPRIFFSMSRDGLLPPSFAKVHPKYRTPHVTTILTGVFVAFFAAFADIEEAVELTNIGTLFAFILVCGSIVILRKTEPNQKRGFKTPWVPVVPALGVLSCIYLMLGLPSVTWFRFLIWLVIGLTIYFLYGFRKSKLNQAT